MRAIPCFYYGEQLQSISAWTHCNGGAKKMGQAFRSLELVVMPVQVMFSNPQKLSKDTKRLQDMQDTLKCAPIRKYFTAFNHGPHIHVDATLYGSVAIFLTEMNTAEVTLNTCIFWNSEYIEKTGGSLVTWCFDCATVTRCSQGLLCQFDLTAQKDPTSKKY